MEQRPHERVRRHIERYDLDGTGVFLLNRGSILNLSPGVMPEVEELFDPFSAMMLRGLAWLLDGGAAGLSPGIQPYPEHLEREIAARALASRR
jgi:adenosylhomocysteinase